MHMIRGSGEKISFRFLFRHEAPYDIMKSWPTALWLSAALFFQETF